MHPALSVIIFSTTTGAGYGLLALLGILTPLDALPQDRIFGFATLALVLGAITVGLLASLFHLGRRERAWRALSQWRSSWLSREGVAAIATYLPAGLFGIFWVFYGRVSAAAGVLAALGAVKQAREDLQTNVVARTAFELMLITFPRVTLSISREEEPAAYA